MAAYFQNHKVSKCTQQSGNAQKNIYKEKFLRENNFTLAVPVMIVSNINRSRYWGNETPVELQRKNPRLKIQFKIRHI